MKTLVPASVSLFCAFGLYAPSPAQFRLAQCFSQGEDVARQVRFFHERIRPNRLHQFVFGDHLVTPAHDYQKKLKGLGSQRDRFTVPQQDLLLRIDPEWSEIIDLACLILGCRHGESLNYSEMTSGQGQL